MSKMWYAAIAGKQYGPLSSSELKSLALCGQLRPDDFVWKEGLSDWFPASRVRGLFPPKPPPPPSQHANNLAPPVAAPLMWPEPSLDNVVLPDSDATNAWKNRDSPAKGYVGVFSRGFRKSIHEFVFTHRQRIAKHFEDGRDILRNDVLDRMANAYSGRGFRVKRFSSSLLVHKRRSRSNASRIDVADDPLESVYTLSHGFVRVSEGTDSWIVELKAEVYFWPRVLEQLMGAAGIACLALIFFWPCLCIIPFMLGVDTDGVLAAMQDELKAPVDKLTIEFL